MIWSIAWKNIWRNKTRSSIVMLAVAFGLFGGTFASAFMNGMSEQRIRTGILTEVSHIQIHHPEFLNNNDIKYSIKDLENKIHEIESMDAVMAASPRIKLTTMANTAETGTGVTLNGIDPEKEKRVSNLFEFVKEGNYFSENKKNQILIGKELAKKLDVKIRSKIIITFQRTDGIISSGAFRVTGIFETNNAGFDNTQVFVNEKDIARLLSFGPNQAHEIAILINDKELAKQKADQLQNMYPNLLVRDWKEIKPELGMLSDMMKQMMIVIIVIILLALGFGIVNTMLMVIMERTREIGMLMAVGMKKSKIFSMILLETIFLSITGGIVGLILCYAVIIIFSKTGIDLSLYAEGLESIGYSTKVYPGIDFTFYFQVVFLTIFTGVVASIFPAIRALKLKPVNAIRAI